MSLYTHTNDGIAVTTLAPNSQKRIKYTCDTCGKVGETTYQNYVQRQLRKADNKTFCRSCALKKPESELTKKWLVRTGRLPKVERKGFWISHDGYKMVRNPAWVQGMPTWSKYIKEHRLVGEKMLGHPLIKTDIVHHINGEKLDNRVENLDVLDGEEQHRLTHISLETIAFKLFNMGLIDYVKETHTYTLAEGKLGELLERLEAANQQPS